MTPNRGYCVRCDGVGRVGESCDNALCKTEGFAFIPSAPYRKVKDRPSAFRDSFIGREFDDYVLIDQLGKGGFSRVYSALQRPVMMPTAIKVMGPSARNQVLDEAELFEKLETEAFALTAVSHPNVVRLIQFVDYAEPPYLVMEQVINARSLHEQLLELVKWDQAMDRDAAQHILSQILNGIEAAHEQGVLHLDIGPRNILLQEVVGEHRFVRIVDFGLGELFDPEEVEVVDDEEEDPRAMGTPEYIAPERLSGGEIGTWTDIYSLGVLAFTLLNWKSPFFGQRRSELLKNKLDPKYRPDSVLEPDSLSGHATKFFRKAMAVDPSDRYVDVAEFRVDLLRIA